MVAAQQLVDAKFDVVIAPHHAEIVRKLRPPVDGQVRNEDVAAEVSEPRNVESGFRAKVRNHVKCGVIKLQPHLILHGRAEGMKPSSLGSIVVCLNQASPRVALQRLHVRILFMIMGEVVAEITRVALAERMIYAPGDQVSAGIVWEQSTIVFKLVHNKFVPRAGRGNIADSENVGQDAGTGGWKRRLAGKTRHRGPAQGC